MRVSNILVAIVTIKQHKKGNYHYISNPNMKVLNILVTNVTIKQQSKIVYQNI